MTKRSVTWEDIKPGLTIGIALFLWIMLSDYGKRLPLPLWLAVGTAAFTIGSITVSYILGGLRQGRPPMHVVILLYAGTGLAAVLIQQYVLRLLEPLFALSLLAVFLPIIIVVFREWIIEHRQR